MNSELKKCVKDPIYFIETYCNTKLTDEVKKAILSYYDGGELIFCKKTIERFKKENKSNNKAKNGKLH